MILLSLFLPFSPLSSRLPRLKTYRVHEVYAQYCRILFLLVYDVFVLSFSVVVQDALCVGSRKTHFSIIKSSSINILYEDYIRVTRVIRIFQYFLRELWKTTVTPKLNSESLLKNKTYSFAIVCINRFIIFYIHQFTTDLNWKQTINGSTQ